MTPPTHTREPAPPTPATPGPKGRPKGSGKPPRHHTREPKADPRLKPRVDIAPAMPAELPPAPEGLLRDLQAAIMRASPRPCPVAALTGALALLAALSGAAYVVRGEQPSLYLACAGEGGDEAAAGIARMIAALAPLAPSITDVVGPSTVGQPASVLRHFGRAPSFACAWTGGPGVLRTMAAGDSRQELHQLLTALWNAPLVTSSMAPELRRPILRPAFTVLASGAAQDLADARAALESPAHRFLSLRSQPQKAVDHPATTPPAALLGELIALHRLAQQAHAADAVIQVQIAPAARMLFDALDSTYPYPYARDIAHRVAAIGAIAADPYAPTIDAELAKWACSLVRADTPATASTPATPKPAEDTLNAKRAKQRQRTLDRIKHYCCVPWSFVSKQALTADLHKAKIVPLMYLCSQLASQTAFASDPAGGTGALNRALSELIAERKVEEVPTSQMQRRFGRTARAFVLA